MPYLSMKTTVPVSTDKEAALKAAFGKAITVFPGKSEQWLMVELQGNCHIWFQGNCDEPSAYVEVKIFGKSTDAAFDAMTAEVCTILNDTLGIPTNRIYVKYEEVDRWGWNGSNF